eukprot:3507-Eustigmatos_ZCMA.PRE.1
MQHCPFRYCYAVRMTVHAMSRHVLKLYRVVVLGRYSIIAGALAALASVFSKVRMRAVLVMAIMHYKDRLMDVCRQLAFDADALRAKVGPV